MRKRRSSQLLPAPSIACWSGMAGGNVVLVAAMLRLLRATVLKGTRLPCPRVAQRDCCRAKSDLRSESCSKPDAQPARDGRNRRTERKKGGREQELRNRQEKRP